MAVAEFDTSTLTAEQVEEALRYLIPDRWAVEVAKISLPKANPPGPLNFELHPFLPGLYRDLWPQIVGMKGAQIGFTTWAFIRSMWGLTTWPISVIYTFPTGTNAGEFSQTRAGPIIKASPYLADRILDLDNIYTKRFGLRPRTDFPRRLIASPSLRLQHMGAEGVSTLYFSGAASETDAQMKDADVLVHDEEDRSDPEVIDQFTSRISGPGQFRWRTRISTPTIPSYGVHAAYLESDQRHWLIRCPSCNVDFEMAFPDNLEPKTWAEHLDRHDPVQTGERCPDCHYICARCNHRLTDDERANGRWVQAVPSQSMVHGYAVSQMAALYVPASQILWNREDQKFDQTFHNLTMGAPFETAGLQLDREVLLSRQDPLREMAKGSTRQTYMGIDVGLMLDIIIDTVENGVVRTIAMIRTPRWSDLYRLMREFKVATAVIDVGPEETLARAFAAAHNRPGETPRVWVCRYLPDSSLKIQWTKDEALVQPPRSRILSEMASELRVSRILPRYDRSPEWEAFIDHHKNSKRLPVWVPGQEGKEIMAYRWVKTGADHLFHAGVYAYLARKAPRDMLPPEVGVESFSRGKARPSEPVPAQILTLPEDELVRRRRGF